MTLEAAIIGGIASVFVALVGGIMAYLNSRTKNKVDVQKTLNETFGALVQELQEERATLLKDRQELRAMLVEQDHKIALLEQRVRRLIALSTKFHNYIVHEGLTPPPFEERDLYPENEH